MKVAQLAQLLDGILQGVSGLVNATTAHDAKTFREALAPFAERNVGEFVGFLLRCEEYHRTGIVEVAAKPKRAPAARKGADPDLVPKAVAAIRAVVEEIDRGRMTDGRIEESLAPFQKYTKPQLDAILAALSLAGKAKTKGEAVEKLGQMLKTQTRMFDKAQAIREDGGQGTTPG